MKSKSIINKGKRFENYICHQIELAGLGKAERTPGSGSGKIKSDVFSNLEFMMEAKNWSNVPKWLLNKIDQAKKETEQGNYYKDKWSLVIRDPRTPENQPDIYVVIDFYQFLELLKKEKPPIVDSKDRDFKYKLTNLKVALQQVIKLLE